MTQDLQSVLARVAEKLHGGHITAMSGEWDDRLWEFKPSFLDYKSLYESNLFRLLLTGNGTFETMDKLHERGLEIETYTDGKAAIVWVYKGGSMCNQIARVEAPTLQEAVARAAYAALEGK